MEVSGRAVKLCREQGFEVYEGTLAETIERLPECDVLVSIEVIEHLSTPAEEVKLMHRVLRPAGLLYITTPNFNGLQRLLTGRDTAIISYPEHLSYFTPRTLSRLTGQSGFKVKQIQSTGFSLSRLQKTYSDRSETLNTAQSADEKLRKSIESNPFLKLIKGLANRFFTLTGTGNSLKGWFIKD